MRSLRDLAVVGLATWRVARLLTGEAGPYDLLHRLREVGQQWQFTRGVLSCPLCCGVWVGPILVAAHRLLPGGDVAIEGLAAAGYAAALDIALVRMGIRPVPTGTPVAPIGGLDMDALSKVLAAGREIVQNATKRSG